MPKLQAAKRIGGPTGGTNATPARQLEWQIRTPVKARQNNGGGLRRCAEECFSLYAPQALRYCRNDLECLCTFGQFREATLYCVYDNCSAYAFSQADADRTFPAVVDSIFSDCIRGVEVPSSSNDPNPQPQPTPTTRSNVPTVWTEPPPSATSSRTPTSSSNGLPNGIPSGSPNDSSSGSGSSNDSSSSNDSPGGILTSSHGGTNVGAIVGGVIGGLAIIALFAGLIFFLIRRSRHTAPRAAANYTPYTPDPPPSGSATPPGYVQGPVPVMASDAKRRVAMAEAYPGPSFSNQAHNQAHSAYTGIERTTSPGVGLVGPGVARTMSVYSGAVSVNPPSTAEGEDEGEDRTRRQ